MSPKTPGIEIIRKEVEEKPTPIQAFTVSFFLMSLLFVPLGIAASILVKIWGKLGVTDASGIYFGVFMGLAISALLSIVFMKFATK